MTQEATGRAKEGARRNLTGKLATKASFSLSNGEGKHLPHYLKASTGSCHDFCKYGMRHAFDANEKSLFLHRSLGKNTSDNKKNGLKSLNLGQRRKKSVIKPTVSSHLPRLKHELIDREQRTISSAKKSGSTEMTEIVKQVTHVWEIVPSEEPDIIKQNNSPVESIGFSDESEIIDQMTFSPVRKKELSEESETRELIISLPMKTNVLSQEFATSEQMNPSLSLSSSPSASYHEEQEHEEFDSTFSEGSDNGQTPHKLKFRRGKVVSLQAKNNAPRRLRFKQGRVVGENQNFKEVGRKSFRRRESVGGYPSNPDVQAPPIVLRHQCTPRKKNCENFNYVIEETAKKLVESRKSKVKALVGAFETVISLQYTGM